MKTQTIVTQAQDLVLSAARDLRAARVSEAASRAKFNASQIKLDTLLHAVRATARAEARCEYLNAGLVALRSALEPPATEHV